ncbi:hypothetical protein NPIL_434461 [Nephila pilipes]|uniref:Uncharacterized protein n=1 Tax=Nephila pilipes TaxID=299642 RepID=A0A8X6IJU2_NEPPI|nr:hypothetical protein NPIL_392031 [Nephila pilipes]GFU12932.1 hypothetical protein NPIL_434461 [Nephila pilipes]
MFLSSHPTHSHTFSGGHLTPFIPPPPSPHFHQTAKDEVYTDRAGIAHINVSEQTLEMEYVSAYSLLGPMQRLQTDSFIVRCFKNSVGPLIPVNRI